MGSDVHSNTLSAGFFSLGAETTIESIEFSGFYLFSDTPQPVDLFSAFIYQDTSGLPGSMPLVTPGLGNLVRAQSGVNTNGFDIYVYTLDLVDFNLNAGDYWLAVQNDTRTDNDDDWAWATGGSLAPSARFRNSRWQEESATFDFTINGSIVASVSEPTGLSLLITGLCVIGLVGWRKDRLRFSYQRGQTRMALS